MEESAPNASNMVTRTYVTSGTSGVSTVAFYMPETVTAPDAFGLALYGAS
jgi:phenylacetate-coenzyme A ligase PaaK-like adenylate-forming protein